MQSTQSADTADPTAAPWPLAGASRLSLGRGYDEALEIWMLSASDRRGLPREDTGRLLLGQLIGSRLGVDPERIRYHREPCPVCGGPNGRPALEWPSASLHFSLARAGGTVLIGIATVPVGVDIEAHPSRQLAEQTAAILHPGDREWVDRTEPGRRAEVMARCWVRKEAYLKGVGTGIAHHLDAEFVSGGPEPAQPPGWTVIDLPVATGFAGAAAIAFRP